MRTLTPEQRRPYGTCVAAGPTPINDEQAPGRERGADWGRLAYALVNSGVSPSHASAITDAIEAMISARDATRNPTRGA